MSRSTKILIFLVITLFVVLGLIWFFVLREPKIPAPVVEEPVNTASTVTEVTPITPPSEEPILAVALDESARSLVGAAQIASAFTERFGSFSNQGVRFRNIRDLQVFMTDSMKEWSEQYIAEAEGDSVDTSVYYGVTTKALSYDITKNDEESGMVEVVIKTQRREAIGTTLNATVYYQEMRVVMKNEAGMWKVDGAYWEKKL